MKKILSFLCIYGIYTSAHAADVGQDGGDPVKKFLYAAFSVPKHYDLLQGFEKASGYVPLSSQGSTYKDIRKAYRGVAPTFHTDKTNLLLPMLPPKTDPSHKAIKALYDLNTLQMQMVNAAYEVFRTEDDKRHYDNMLSVIDLYSNGIKLIGPVVGAYFLYTLYGLYRLSADKDPKRQLKNLQKFVHLSVESLVNNNFNRNDDAEQKLLIKTWFSLPVSAGASQETLHSLESAIADMDAQLQKTYTKMAWEYYDCASIEDLKVRDLKLVENLTAASEKLNIIIEQCKSELEDAYNKRHGNVIYKLGCLCVIPVAIAAALKLSTWWMQRQMGSSFRGSLPAGLPSPEHN